MYEDGRMTMTERERAGAWSFAALLEAEDWSALPARGQRRKIARAVVASIRGPGEILAIAAVHSGATSRRRRVSRS